MAPHGVYPARGEDRWLSIAVENDAAWQALAGIIGCEDPRFAGEAGRQAHREEIDALVSLWSAGQDANEAAALLPGLPAPGMAAPVAWPVTGTPRICLGAPATLTEAGARRHRAGG